MAKYKFNRPIVVMPRKWWRHPVFPWGVYSMVQDDFSEVETLFVDGYSVPFDGGGGMLTWGPESNDT